MGNDNQGWADKTENRTLVRRLLYAACALLVVADFLVHRHVSTSAESIPAFYVLYGFIALVGVVMAAKGLRVLVKRDEDYYER